MRTRRFAQVMIAASGALALTALAASPASAYTRNFVGGGWSSYAGVGDDLKWVEVCDLDRDGNGVFGQFKLSGGGTMTVWDGNGSQGGCGNQTSGSNITSFRVCIDSFPDICSRWNPAA